MTGGSAGPLFPPGPYAYGRTVEDQRRGIRWTPFSTHEDLDFADDLALLSHTWQHIQEKTDRVSIFSDQVGLTIILKKTEAMRVNVPSPTVIGVRGHGIPSTNKFTYLGSMVRQDHGGLDRGITAKIGKARVAFIYLSPVWRSKPGGKKTTGFSNTNVKSVYLYGSKAWKTVKATSRKI